MKAILEFNLDEPEDKKAHQRCVSSTSAYLVLHELDQELRGIVKYDKWIEEDSNIALPEGDVKITAADNAILRELAIKIRYKLSELMEDYGVDLNDLD